MKAVPTWKWVLVLLFIFLSAWYLYPSYVWYRLPAEIRNKPNPVTTEIAELDTQLATLRSATGELQDTGEIRRLEEQRQDILEGLYDLRQQAVPLGLDLAGGMHVVLEIEEASETVTLTPEDEEGQQSLLEQAMTVYQARIDKLGLTEPIIEKQPPNRILIQIPGVKSPDEVLKILRATARLEFRLTSDSNTFVRTMDAVIGLSPQIQEMIQLSGAPFTQVAAQNVDSVSRALHIARLEVPPDLSFMWGPLERQPGQDEAYRNLYLIEDQVLMAGDTLTKAFVTFQTGMVTQPIVSLEFNREGTAQFARVTTDHVKENLAIVLDGVVYSAPTINEPIRGGQAIISGSFSTQEASALAIVLEAGALKTNVRIVENRSIGPSLGLDSITKGLGACKWGLIAILIFMPVYYFLSGMFADIALILNLVFLSGALAMFHATLTLPGIAGVLLTIGMCVDANVLVFERIREEVSARSDGPAATAVNRGYGRALSAILDSNITTLLTALVLMNFGTGPIRGFAITLSVGVLISLFTALFVTRIFQDWRAVGRKSSQLSVGNFRPLVNSNFDFMRIAPPFVVVSALLLVGGLVYTIIHWSDIRGIELTGGSMVRLEFEEPVELETLRGQLTDDLKLTTYQIQSVGGENKEFIVRLKQGTEIPAGQEVVTVMADAGGLSQRAGEGVIYTRPGEPEVDLSNFVTVGLDVLNPANAVEPIGIESFTASFGEELAQKGVVIVVFSWFFILLYLSVRFQFAYGVAAVVALVHDVLITMGALGIANQFGVHRELNLSTIAALLTVIGYSVNDTIVVFDRIRENRRGGTETLREIINRSINQSLSRTLITSLTTFIVVLILFLTGGDVINDFAFVLLVGVLVGTYSSIIVGSYVLYLWQGRRKTLRAQS